MPLKQQLFFNKISDKFEPLQPHKIPATYHRDLPLLSPVQAQQMLIQAKKKEGAARRAQFLGSTYSTILYPPQKLENFRPKVVDKPIPQPVLIVPPLEEKTGTQVLVEKSVKTFKYIDDNIIVEKVKFGKTRVEKKTRRKFQDKASLGDTKCL